MYSHPISNVQLEISKTFSYNLSDLQKLKDTLTSFFAERAIKYANNAWQDNEWTEKKMDELVNTKLRKTN